MLKNISQSAEDLDKVLESITIREAGSIHQEMRKVREYLPQTISLTS